MPDATPVSLDDDRVLAARKNARAAYTSSRRYKRARWLAAAIVGLIVTAVLNAMFESLKAQHLVPTSSFKVMAFLALVAGIAGAWLLVEMLWRWKLRRNYWEWQ